MLSFHPLLTNETVTFSSFTLTRYQHSALSSSLKCADSNQIYNRLVKKKLRGIEHLSVWLDFKGLGFVVKITKISDNMISSGINLVMTIIGFAVSVMFIVFVCTRLVCARIHLNSSRRSFPIASRSNLSLLERGLHGLEPVTVATFPTKKYSDEYFAATEDAQCTVCLSEYHGEDTLRILPYCGHSFHVTCIDIWLQQHSTCPMCRVSLRELPVRERLMQPLFSSAVRLHYSTEAFDASHNPFNFLLTDHEFSSRTLGTDHVQEHPYASQGGREEVGETSPPTSEGNQTTKDSGNKHVESPSNP